MMGPLRVKHSQCTPQRPMPDDSSASTSMLPHHVHLLMCSAQGRHKHPAAPAAAAASTRPPHSRGPPAGDARSTAHQHATLCIRAQRSTSACNAMHQHATQRISRHAPAAASLGPDLAAACAPAAYRHAAPDAAAPSSCQLMHAPFLLGFACSSCHELLPAHACMHPPPLHDCKTCLLLLELPLQPAHAVVLQQCARSLQQRNNHGGSRHGVGAASRAATAAGSGCPAASDGSRVQGSRVQGAVQSMDQSGTQQRPPADCPSSRRQRIASARAQPLHSPPGRRHSHCCTIAGLLALLCS